MNFTAEGAKDAEDWTRLVFERNESGFFCDCTPIAFSDRIARVEQRNVARV